jgi:hypothetical protein
MEFYAKRTVEEQAERLPEQYRANYEATQLDRIEIDGCEIQGYFEYSFMEEKSYVEQPVRSQDGSIADLDNITSFLTPRLIIKYNMMHIDDYRTLMTFLKSKNTFNVTCYDIDVDRRVTHEMYFAPPQMPIIYQRYLAALGVQEYSIELIGTNRRTDDMQITFSINGVNHTAYSNDTWLSFVLRGESDYKVVYSPARSTVLNKIFVITSDDGTTAIKYNNTAVSPHDKIIANATYEVS